MIDPLPEDGDLAQARHAVRLAEKAVREANERAALAEIQARLGWERAAEKDRAYGLALHLRDEAAREHERERTRRQEAELLLGLALVWHDRGELHDDPDLPWNEIRAHLRQEEKA